MTASSERRAPEAAAWLLALAAIVGAVAASGAPGSAGGAVTGPDERPLPGAAVRVAPADGSAPAREATTGDDGRWRLAGLEPGRWRIEITADGHLPAEGWFQVAASGPPAAVDVELRSLEETPPSFAENASTVVRWIERGNALLAQGESADARAQYERALPLIAREQRPEILQAIARTHFVEGDVDRAIERMQQAVGIAPDDPQLRQLFLGVLDSAGRRDEAERLLAEAPSRAAAADPEPPPTPATAGPGPERLPVVGATRGRTGRFRTRFSARSPLSDIEVYRLRYGMSEAELLEVDPEGGAYDLTEESFHVAVPESYSDDRPHGLIVWVSPTPYGGFSNPETARVLAERGLIWIGAHDAGNSRWGWYRVGLALDAVHNMRERYTIDPERIYVSGYSGGGRISSQLSMLYPDVFRGGFFLYGVDFYEQLPVPDRPGSFWPARFEEPPKEIRARLETESRFVILTGDRDFNRSQSKVIYRRMREAGFEHVTYLQIPGADHYGGLPPEWLERALDALDRPASG